MYGWQGKILRVDLSTGMISETDTEQYKQFVGGIGIGMKVVWDEAPIADPFSPENRMVFAVGPLTGTPSPSTGRTEVTSISPHTYAPEAKNSLMTRSGFGGYWGAELKFAGYDAIIIHGKAAKPVYLWINDGKVSLRSAEHLWGLDTYETQEKIVEELGEKRAQIACIGPSGENLVRIAPIVHRTGNAAGQGGFGAVMGSKNLKAIAVRGTKGVKVADMDALREVVKDFRAATAAPLGATPLSQGPLSWTEKWIDPHDVNKQALRYDQTKANAPYLNHSHQKSLACYSCPLACYSYNRVPGMGGGQISCTQWFYAFMGNQDEATFLAKQLADKLGVDTYEMFSIIPLVWHLFDSVVDDKRVIFHALDQGLVAEEQVAGLQEMHYPPEGSVNAKGIETLIHMIVYRQGELGDMLAEGAMRACDLLIARFEGLGMPAVAEAVRKYTDLDGFMQGTGGGHGGWGMSGHYDPRTYGYYWALGWAVENRDPNRHGMTKLLHWTGLNIDQAKHIAKQFWGEEITEAGLTDLWRAPEAPLVWDDEKSPYANAFIARFMHQRGCIKDILTVCDWVYPMMTSGLSEREYTGDLSVEYKYFAAVTGEQVDQAELDLIAERIWALHRVLTLVEWGGWEPVNMRQEHDQIPEHYYLKEEERASLPWPPGPDCHPPLDKARFEVIKEEYYKLLGWDPETGIPTRARLEELGLKDVADKLEEKGIKLS